MKKTYTVSLTGIEVQADSPLEAAHLMLELINEEGKYLIYDVEDTESNEKYTVDLSEEDEDVVLPNND